jgi:hypothetical protein
MRLSISHLSYFGRCRMIVAVTGGRNYTDMKKVWDVLDAHLINDPDMILHVGDATGLDTMALEWAVFRGVEFHRFIAEWDKYGRAAGPIRNKEMINGVDMLYSFPGGRGTAHATSYARETGKEVVVV